MDFDAVLKAQGRKRTPSLFARSIKSIRKKNSSSK
jgi:hypothetical protein